MTDKFDTDQPDDIGLDSVANPGDEADLFERHRPEDEAPGLVTAAVIDLDLEVPVADAWEQSLPGEPDTELVPIGQITLDLDAGVAEADAWEQALPVAVDDDH